MYRYYVDVPAHGREYFEKLKGFRGAREFASRTAIEYGMAIHIKNGRKANIVQTYYGIGKRKGA